MHKAEHRGELTINGKRADNEMLGHFLGQPESEIAKVMEEILKNNIFSTRDDGMVYSRRMIREAEEARDLSQIRAEAGLKGAEIRWQGDGKTMAKMANDGKKSIANDSKISYGGLRQEPGMAKYSKMSMATLGIF
jgi:hypothetical protein